MILSGRPAEVAEQPKACVIDEAHLARMTLGDGGLEREILEIFLRQASLMLNRIATGKPLLVAAAAHTLLGSARGIGAHRLASAAERLECAAMKAGDIGEATTELGGATTELGGATRELKSATTEASAAICARLRVSSAAAKGDL